MKKLFYPILLFIILFSTKSNSQKTSIGFAGGLLNGSGKVKENSASASSSDSGFYLGLYSKIQLNEKFSLIPEIDYGNLNDRSFGFVSARIGYYLISDFYLQAGPQVTYLFDVLTDDVAKAGLDISLGIGYDITDKFHVQARYAFEASNRVKESNTDVTARFNWLNVGLGYSF